MPSEVVNLIILLTFISQVHANLLARNRTHYEIDSEDQLSDRLVEEAVLKLFNHALKAWPLHHADLNDTSLAHKFVELEKVTNELFDRASKASTVQHVKLDNTTLGKSGRADDEDDPDPDHETRGARSILATPAFTPRGSRENMKERKKESRGNVFPKLGDFHMNARSIPESEDARIAACVADVRAHLGRARSGNKLIEMLPSEAKKQIGLAWAIKELRKEFAEADKNKDGVLSLAEFENWARAITDKTQDRTPPSRRQLIYAFIRSLPPFIGFGFVDNALMVLSGGVIDDFLGTYLGISTMASAALGNSFSNGIGMLLHGVIERCANALRLPDPQLTIHQMQRQSTHVVKTVGSVLGILIGCLLGMLPLIFMRVPDNPNGAI